jgi:hypothetical protein
MRIGDLRSAKCCKAHDSAQRSRLARNRVILLLPI